jgi:REP element-mobilizing transposase RayT
MTRIISAFFAGHIRNSLRGRIVQPFKSITTREIFTRKPSVEKHLWGRKLWTDGCCVATFGERADWKTVEE